LYESVLVSCPFARTVIDDASTVVLLAFTRPIEKVVEFIDPSVKLVELMVDSDQLIVFTGIKKPGILPGCYKSYWFIITELLALDLVHFFC